jgi:hypothetical protein
MLLPIIRAAGTSNLSWIFKYIRECSKEWYEDLWTGKDVEGGGTIVFFA